MSARNPSPRTCKAVVIHDVGRASLSEVEIPAVAPAEVMIEVAYVGVCATDLKILDGTLGYYRDQRAQYPVVPGHEVSGTIVAVGAQVNDLCLGDPVVVECIQGCGDCAACSGERAVGCQQRAELGVVGVDGGYAELIVVPARFVHRIGTKLDLKEACITEPLAVVLKGLNRLASVWGDTREPKNCGVLGAGPIGRLFATVLAYRGHTVTLFDQDASRLNGMDHEVGTAQDFDRLGEFDAIVEATGDQKALEAALGNSRAGVNILLLGLPYHRALFNFEQLVANDKAVIGSVGSSSRDFTEALNLLPKLDTSAFTQTVLPLENFQQGWESARSRSHLKCLLSPLGK